MLEEENIDPNIIDPIEEDTILYTPQFEMIDLMENMESYKTHIKYNSQSN